MNEALHRKWSFILKISSVNLTKSANLVTLTEEILNRQDAFFVQWTCSVVILSFCVQDGWYKCFLSGYVVVREQLISFTHFHAILLPYISMLAFWSIFCRILKGRSTHRRFCIEKGFLKIFAKFTGKHLSQILFFNKVFKKQTLSQVFPCEYCEIFKNICFEECCFWKGIEIKGNMSTKLVNPIRTGAFWDYWKLGRVSRYKTDVSIIFNHKAIRITLSL